MASPDVQIVRDGPTAVPLDYTLPQSAGLQPLAVNAVFDGSSAAGSYLPCVVIIGASGTVIARSAADTTVAAGDDAEVSWFPGVKNAPASVTPTGAGVAYAHAYYTTSTDPPFGVPGGTNANSPFPHTYTTDATVFTWSTSVNTNDTLHLGPVGTYICYYGLQRSGGGGSAGGMILSGTPSEFPHQYFDYPASPPVQDPVGLPTDGDYAVYHTIATNTTVNVLLENPSGFNMSVFLSYLSVIYLATGA